MQNVPLRLEGTFAYAVTVPSDIRAVWPAQIDVQIRSTPGQQLLGDCPTLHLVDIGIIEGGGPLARWCSILKPRVAATEFTLTSNEATDVGRSVSFRVDRAFAAAIRPGDEVHRVGPRRSGCCCRRRCPHRLRHYAGLGTMPSRSVPALISSL